LSSTFSENLRIASYASGLILSTIRVINTQLFTR
jgi:hypothetical protein